MFPSNYTSKMAHKTCVTTTFTQYFRMSQWMGLRPGYQNHKDFCLCGAPRGVPGCRNFVVYPTDNDHPSVLHQVSRRTLAYNFLYISFYMNELENVKHIVMSPHFSLQNQKNANICHKLHNIAKTRH